MKVLIYGHKIKDETEFSYVESLFSAAKEHEILITVYRPYMKELLKYNLDYKGLPTIDNNRELKENLPDFVITLGGDGTILHAITLIRETGIPILGINLGRLGFLASVEKKILKKAILQLLKKEFTIVSRSLLGLQCNLPLFTSFPFALNDFTLNKRDTSSMITIHTFVDDVLLNSYWADGIIISTPTGSTGYSLSCGGPIIFPDSQNFAITPVAPHNLNVRPIVIPDNKKISLKVEGRTDSFMCTLDSRYETVTSEHLIEINKGQFSMNFVQLKGQTFMKTISEKLLWGLDKRN
ncbi:MAG: NAD kinase [Saprospiraceae bacterium]|nr:NAD kinase [Saprospiraceae bacterium]